MSCGVPAAAVITLGATVCPYPWLLLQRLLLEMILLVLVADQSQSLT